MACRFRRRDPSALACGVPAPRSPHAPPSGLARRTPAKSSIRQQPVVRRSGCTRGRCPCTRNGSPSSQRRRPRWQRPDARELERRARRGFEAQSTEQLVHARGDDGALLRRLEHDGPRNRHAGRVDLEARRDRRRRLAQDEAIGVLQVPGCVSPTLSPARWAHPSPLVPSPPHQARPPLWLCRRHAPTPLAVVAKKKGPPAERRGPPRRTRQEGARRKERCAARATSPPGASSPPRRTWPPAGPPAPLPRPRPPSRRPHRPPRAATRWG